MSSRSIKSSLCLLITCLFLLMATSALSADTGKEYIFRDSSVKLLTENDLLCLSPQLLRLARNEISARHGYIFKQRELADYFARQSWYRPAPAFRGELPALTRIEQRNITLIRQHEELRRNTGLSDTLHLLKAEFDLNGDGRPEQIRFKPGQEYAPGLLTINGVSLKVNTEFPFPLIQVVDLDYSDSLREIWIAEAGPSDDYASSFFRWMDGKIVPLGKICGIKLIIDGSNRLISKLVRGSILHTWFRQGVYRVTMDQRLQEIPMDLYAMNTPLKVRASIPLQRSRHDCRQIARLKPGEKIVLLSTDDRKWCLVKTASGRQGWFAVDDFDLIRGTGLHGRDVFEGLCYAD